MGKTRHKDHRLTGGDNNRSFSSSPSSSSSSDFEFTVSLSPSSKRSFPADELFYKGQLLPLHLSPRISMVRTLLLASSSTSSSSDAATTASRDSTASSSSSSDLLPDSSRPSSAEDADKLLSAASSPRRPKYFSSFATRFSAVFLHRKKDVLADKRPPNLSTASSAKEVIKKYVKKVKPLYEKFSKQPHNSKSTKKSQQISCFAGSGKKDGIPTTTCISHSFSGNLRYARRSRCAGSCPSSMRSSPSHSGLLSGDPTGHSSSSSMEELQSAIQGAITHCKSSMVKSKMVSSDQIR